MDWQALLLSLKLASLTTLLLLMIGLPLAYGLSKRRGLVVNIIEALISFPLVLPPTVLGFYLLLALSRLHMAFSFTGLLLASMLYSFPFALQPFLSAFGNVDKRLIEASWILGQSSFVTFLRVTIPMAMPGIVSGAILSFAHTLGEFGVVLMIGGNIAGVTRTLSISIYDHVESLNYAAANQTAAFLLIVSFIALLAVSLLRKRALVIV